MTHGQDTGPRVQRARLGAELRRLRVLAGLSGRQVADRVGIGQASVSRIENGQQVPSLPEVTTWGHTVSATDEQHASLVALTEIALNEVESWRARMRGGLPAMQADTEQLEATSRLQRCFQPTLVPGLEPAGGGLRRRVRAGDVWSPPPVDLLGDDELRGHEDQLLVSLHYASPALSQRLPKVQPPVGPVARRVRQLLGRGM